jgi:uncharacterized protein (DUF885 family)
MIISALNFETVKDYEDYIKRLHALPKLFDRPARRWTKACRTS